MQKFSAWTALTWSQVLSCLPPTGHTVCSSSIRGAVHPTVFMLCLCNYGGSPVCDVKSWSSLHTPWPWQIISGLEWNSTSNIMHVCVKARRPILSFCSRILVWERRSCAISFLTFYCIAQSKSTVTWPDSKVGYLWFIISTPVHAANVGLHFVVFRSMVGIQTEIGKADCFCRGRLSNTNDSWSKSTKYFLSCVSVS